MMLDLLKMTVARGHAVSEAMTKDGTAFLVTRRHVLTCAHCLGDETSYAKEVELLFTGWDPDNRKQQAMLVGMPNWELDVALLELKADAPHEPMLRSTAAAGDAWYGWGHPSLSGEDGITFDGKVMDPDARHFHRRAMQLDCRQAADKIHGASGSPIVVDGRIVGILTSQLLQRDPNAVVDTLKPALRAIYALPFSVLAQHPGFDFLLHSQELERARRIVAAAGTPAAALMRRRIAAEGTYVAERYVPRETATAAFDAFMRQDKYRCFLIVAKAGCGKTTLLSHLALRSEAGPSLYFRGSVDDYSVAKIAELIRETLVGPEVGGGAATRDVDAFMDALRQAGQSLTLFIDAINETPFQKIPERRTELQQLLEYVADRPIRVVVACRDVFWKYFIDPRGQSADFWWLQVHDPTFDAQVDAEVERQIRLLQQKQAQTAQPGTDPTAIDKESLSQIKKAACAAVEHRPTLLLGDYTSAEAKTALGRYNVTNADVALQPELHHPLFLRLYCEIASGAKSQEKPMSMGDVLERYVEYKIASVQKALLAYDTKGTRRFLSRLTHEMRTACYGRVSGERVDQIIDQDPDPRAVPDLRAIKVYLLSEGIILENKADDQIGFQFDALFEYMLGQEMIRGFLPTTDNETHIRTAGHSLVEEARHFESMVGAFGYACSILERDHPDACRKLLGAVAGASTFGRAMFLRVWPDLSSPLGPGIKESLFTALRDRDVLDSTAIEALARVVERWPDFAIPLAHAAVEEDDEVTLARCAKLITFARALPGRRRTAIAATLLGTRRPGAASKVASELALLMQDERQYKGSVDEDLAPLFAPDAWAKMSIQGLVIFLNFFVVAHGDKIPSETTRELIIATALRPEIQPRDFIGAFLNVSLQLMFMESSAVLALAEIPGRRPEFKRAMPALFTMLCFVGGGKPAKQEWLIASFARHALAAPKSEDFIWRAIAVAIRPGDVSSQFMAVWERYSARWIGWSEPQSVPALLVRVVASLTRPEADEVMRKVARFGGGIPLKIHVTTAALCCFTSRLLVAFICSMAMPPPALMPYVHVLASTDAVSFSIRIMAIMTIVLYMSSGVAASVRTQPVRERLLFCALTIVAGGIIAAFHPDWFVIGLLLAFLMGASIALVCNETTPLSLLQSTLQLALQLVAFGAVGVFAVTPAEWLLPRLGWTGTLLAMASISLWHWLLFGAYRMVSALVRSGALVGACVLVGMSGEIRFVDLAPLAIASGTVISAAFVTYRDYQKRILFGFAGKWLAYGMIVPATGIVILALLGLWTWIAVLAALSGLLLVPVSWPWLWILHRAGPAVSELLFGLVVALPLALTSRPTQGAFALFCHAYWWICVLSPLLLIGRIESDSRVSADGHTTSGMGHLTLPVHHPTGF